MANGGEFILRQLRSYFFFLLYIHGLTRAHMEKKKNLNKNKKTQDVLLVRVFHMGLQHTNYSF